MIESAEVGHARKVSMSPEAKPEGAERELAEIRREVIEARNLVIKTDNLLKNLHAEVKMVGKRQEDFQKRQWISSAAAYVGFAVLCVAGAIGISSARTAGANSERDELQKQVADLSSQVQKIRADQTAQAQAQRQAGEVYKLMTTLSGDDRLKGVDELVKLDTSKLSPLEKKALDDRAELLRREIGQAAYERGKAAFRKSDMEETAKELSRFMAMNPDPTTSLDAQFFLGVAYNQLKRHDKAVPLLQHFADEDKKSKTRDYAMLLLAQSYQETNQLEKAAETVRAAMADYPASQFAAQFRGRLSTVKRLQGGEPEVAVAPAAQTTPAAQPKPAAAAQPAQPKPAAATATAPAAAPAPAPKPQ